MLFRSLERIKCAGCPLLRSFPFLEYSSRFTNLCELVIHNCPELSQFPSMPHTSTLTSLSVRNATSKLSYNGKEFTIGGYNHDLSFDNMDKVEVMEIRDVSGISLSDIQRLNSLRSLSVERCENIFSAQLDDNVALHSVQSLELEELSITGEEFSKALRSFPAISQLSINKCKSLVLLPLEDGGGLWDLVMLQSFSASYCHKLFCRWPMGEVGGAQTIKPFPPSLRKLKIVEESSIKSMALLSNLTSLTYLELVDCEELTMDGFNPHITTNLKDLSIYDKQRISVGADVLSEVARDGLMHAGSFELEKLAVNSISALLGSPVCSHLAATLHTLQFRYDRWVETFTEEQEQALQLLTSLQDLQFSACSSLQSLPQQLRGLSSLRTLVIFGCEKIRSLPPKESLNASLSTIIVADCSPELTENAKNLKKSDTYSAKIIVCP